MYLRSVARGIVKGRGLVTLMRSKVSNIMPGLYTLTSSLVAMALTSALYCSSICMQVM